jgi:galactitol-specific phosphotransferase system IIB component
MIKSLCECGCGFEPNKGKRFLWGHNGRKKEGKVWLTAQGYMSRDKNGTSLLLHREIAEKVVEHKLSHKVHVHHVDENRSNNVNCNLVVCQGIAYHKLLHTRRNALLATGHVDWIKCNFCKKYDDPNKLFIFPNGKLHYHKKCRNEYRNKHDKLKRDSLKTKIGKERNESCV